MLTFKCELWVPSVRPVASFSSTSTEYARRTPLFVDRSERRRGRASVTVSPPTNWYFFSSYTNNKELKTIPDQRM